MNIFNSLSAQAATSSPGLFGDSRIGLIVMLVGFMAIFYFLIILPQNKKKKAAEKMMSSLKKGDKVITIGGIHGKIVSIKDNEITLKVDSNAEITFEKGAISRAAATEVTQPKK